MTDLVRLSLSIEKKLYVKLEGLVKKSGYRNRSEYVRDMIRDQLVKEKWARHQEVVATLTIIYNHHKRELSEKLTELQHSYHDLVLAATHVHLSEHICAEMIMLRGQAEQVQKLADLLGQQVGVLHFGLTMSTTGEEL